MLKPGRVVYLVEEFLFFKQYPFHKQKIAFHRSSMRFYFYYVREKNFDITYIEAHSRLSDVRKLLPYLAESGVTMIHYVDPVDDWLEKRIKSSARAIGLRLNNYDSPLFLNSNDELEAYFDGQSTLRQTSFYIKERKKRNILINPDNSPVGGKLSFDS